MKKLKNDNLKNLYFITLILLFVSCSNNEETTSSNNSGLLKTIVTYGVTNFGTQTFKSKEVNLFYSENNRLDYVTVATFGSTSTGRIATIKYHYTGDLITLKERFIDNNPIPSANHYFKYDNQNRVIEFKRYYDTTNSRYTYEYLPNGNILQRYYIQEGLNFIFSSSKNLSFDANLNLKSNGFENYEYDNKLSSIYGILGLDKIYYIDQLSDDHFYPTYFNNIIYLNNLINGNIVAEENSTYEYNSNNKPVKKIQNGLVIKNYLYY